MIILLEFSVSGSEGRGFESRRGHGRKVVAAFCFCIDDTNIKCCSTQKRFFPAKNNRQATTGNKTHGQIDVNPGNMRNSMWLQHDGIDIACEHYAKRLVAVRVDHTLGKKLKRS